MPITLEFTPRLLTTVQAAHYLGISVSMLQTLDLPRVKLGAKRLYDRIELDAFADGLEREVEAEGDEWESHFADKCFGIETQPMPRPPKARW